MAFVNLTLKRLLSSKQNDVGSIFFNPTVQKFLTDVSRFEDSKVFAPKPIRGDKTQDMIFATEEQLEILRDNARQNAAARVQMPPVLPPDTSAPKILEKNDDIVGYTKFKVMFVDISPGFNNRNRLMSVREPNGILRYPTQEERSRLNQIFYPQEDGNVGTPKMFEEAFLLRLLDRKEYTHILDKACFEFEPDDPRYVNVVSRVYEHINDKQDFKFLISTRHYGSMCLHLAYNKKADNLISHKLSEQLLSDAAKLVKVYNICHNIDCDEGMDDLSVVKHYIENESSIKAQLQLLLQGIEESMRSNSK